VLFYRYKSMNMIYNTGQKYSKEYDAKTNAMILNWWGGDEIRIIKLKI